MSVASTMRARAPAEEWPALLRRCADLGIGAHHLGLEEESVEAALAAIGAASRVAAWKKGQRNKLRKRVQRAIEDAEPHKEPAVGAEMPPAPPAPPAQPPLPPPPPHAMDVDPQPQRLPPLPPSPPPEAIGATAQHLHEAERALNSYVGGLPISPAGYFKSRERLLEWHELGEPPPDQSSWTEHWRLASECVAWDDATTAFCCVGVPQYCADGCLPHNVAASMAQPQRALAHLVEWTHASAHRTRVEICVERQCAICAQMLIGKGCPLAVVAIAAFRDAERHARREAAAASEGGCAVCEADTDAPSPQNASHWPGVYRRGRALLQVFPGMRAQMINPRERPCVLCDAGGSWGAAHTSACPCVNIDSVPEWHADLE